MNESKKLILRIKK